MSREDKKRAEPTPEENFFSGITSEPLKDWEQGRNFIASDNKALLVFETLQSSLFPDTTAIKGKTLKFVGVSSNIAADGSLTLMVELTDGSRVFFYDTGKDFDSAMENFMSSEIPMLIDRKMVDQAANLLTGKKIWTRSNLWYNQEGERIDGKKYVPVTVTDVTPGNMVFPLRLELLTDDGVPFFMFMNFGNADTESRSFHNLFSLTDPEKLYPAIQPEIWQLICQGKVTDGMTKQECRLALGNPIDITSGHDYSQTLDIWTYENGIILWFEDGRLVRHKG